LFLSRKESSNINTNLYILHTGTCVVRRNSNYSLTCCAANWLGAWPRSEVCSEGVQGSSGEQSPPLAAALAKKTPQAAGSSHFVCQRVRRRSTKSPGLRAHHPRVLWKRAPQWPEGGAAGVLSLRCCFGASVSHLNLPHPHPLQHTTPTPKPPVSM
jgi:hypothetical protein